MLVSPSRRRSLAALSAGALVAASLVLAAPAHAATASPVKFVGTFNSKWTCQDKQRAYNSSWTRVVYPCYSMTPTAWVFGYVTVTG